MTHYIQSITKPFGYHIHKDLFPLFNDTENYLLGMFNAFSYTEHLAYLTGSVRTIGSAYLLCKTPTTGSQKAVFISSIARGIIEVSCPTYRGYLAVADLTVTALRYTPQLVGQIKEKLL